ncbi:threonine synthase [bacterium]|nr:threonine synthase [bacterium]
MNQAVQFRSTRDKNQVGYSLLEAVEKGLAPDGGLFLPETMPSIAWHSLPSTSFQECAEAYLNQWLSGSISIDQVSTWVQSALDFPVPLVSLGDSNTHVLELYHGPTLSFKDFGARSMAFLLGERIRETQTPVTILVATSGDTGSAVADGLSGIEGVRVVLLYPKDQVSKVQEKQLISKRPGVVSVRVAGTFDDCQRMVKGSFSDPKLSNEHLSTANSINIGRLIPQMLYYVWATRLLMSERCNFVVPSGNLGNLTAGLIAHLSGMPVAHFVAAHNDNDFFPRYLNNPDSHFKDSKRTVSNAMDVGAPSNFERLTSLLKYETLKALVSGLSISDAETRASISEVYKSSGYIADPHTAVGLVAAKEARSMLHAKGPIVVLSTAHPAKFPEIVEKEIGKALPEPSQLSALDSKPVNVIDLDPEQAQLAELILSSKW